MRARWTTTPLARRRWRTGRALRFMSSLVCLLLLDAKCESSPEDEDCGECAVDTECPALTVCSRRSSGVSCCEAGCRSDYDCIEVASPHCMMFAPAGHGVCRGVEFLNGRQFEFAFNCTRTFKAGTPEAYCADSQQTASLVFSLTTTAADGSADYSIESVPAKSGETWTGHISGFRMGVTLETAEDALDAAYKEVGTFDFWDSYHFTGKSNYEYLIPDSDPNAGGGECTQIGWASGPPGSPATIGDLCPCLSDNSSCSHDGSCCSRVCYSGHCVP